MQQIGGGDGRRLQGFSRLAYLRYDYRNQMVEYEDQTDGTRIHRYLYDCFGRRFGTRYDKLAVNFQAFLDLAIIRRYLRILAPHDPSDTA